MTHSQSHSQRQLQSPAQPVSRRLLRLAAATLGFGLFAAAMWFAWLGWDDEYHLVDGVAQGPYQAWQVLGCGAAIAVGAVVAYLWVREPWGVPVLAAGGILGFAVPWTVDAAATDDSGLFVVGLLLLLVGGGVGLTVLLGVTAALASLLPARGGSR